MRVFYWVAFNEASFIKKKKNYKKGKNSIVYNAFVQSKNDDTCAHLISITDFLKKKLRCNVIT